MNQDETKAVQRPAGNINAIPLGEGRMLRVDGQLVAVFRLRDGNVRATQPWCPHRAGPLADGLLDDTHLVCPLHGRTFSLDTGQAGPDEAGIITYPARVSDDGTIVITLPVDRPLPSCSDNDRRPSPRGQRATAAPLAQPRRAARVARPTAEQPQSSMLRTALHSR
jgi:nitrite reductase (NADH) small subunit